MRFRPADLEGIAAGRITLAFRRWERPRVKVGSRLKTPVGVLAVDAVDAVDHATDEEARAAGYADASEVVFERPGQLYRVALRLVGPDPRVALRETPPDAALFARLERLPWAYDVLAAIAAHPGLRAPDLAARFGRETLPFKRDVRKLKELGLTESLRIGYRLSRRGQLTLSSRPNARRNTSP